MGHLQARCQKYRGFKASFSGYFKGFSAFARRGCTSQFALICWVTPSPKILGPSAIGRPVTDLAGVVSFSET